MRRKYEIGFILNPEANDDEIKRIIDSILEIIKNDNGTVENVNERGRRKLAYPIEKHNEGIYVFINADAGGTVFTQIERRLKLSEKVMRFIVLRLDDRLKKANRLIKKWKRSERSRKPADDERESRGSRDSRDDRDSRGPRESRDSKDTREKPDRPRGESRGDKEVKKDEN